MTTIWNDTTNALVRAGWGKKEPDAIAAEVRAALPVPGPTTGAQGAGIIWQAFKLGLIDEKQREEALRRNKRLHKATLPKALRDEVLAAEPQCRCCGAWESLQVARVVPPLAGGGDDRANLWTLCKGCSARASTRAWPTCIRPATTTLPLAGWVNHARRMNGNGISLGSCAHGKELALARANNHLHFWRVAHATPMPGSKQVRFEDSVLILAEQHRDCWECEHATFPVGPYLPEVDEPAFLGDEIEGLVGGRAVRGTLVGVRPDRYLLAPAGTGSVVTEVEQARLLRPAPMPVR